MVIPQDLQVRFERRELVTSLRTELYHTASSKCAILTGKINELFAYVRIHKMLTASDIKEICRNLFKSYIQTHSQFMESQEKAPLAHKLVGKVMNTQIQARIKGKDAHAQKLPNELIDDRVQKIIQQKGLKIVPDSVEYARLKAGVYRMMQEWEHYINEYQSGELEISPQDEWFTDLYPNYQTPQEVSESSVTTVTEPISEVLKKHLAETEEEDKSKLIKQTAVNYFIEWIDDKQIHTITKADARLYKDNLMKMPKNAKKKFPEKSIKELPLGTYADNEKMSIKTINSYLTPMVTLFNWAKKNWDGLEKENPFSGMAIKAAKSKKDARRSFSHSELKTIFSNPLFTGCKSDTKQGRFVEGDKKIKDEKYWIPLIALLTGARMNEICQLHVGDIYNEDGLWVLDINRNGENKKLKSEASKRRIPVHAKLLELGLESYIKKQQDNGQIRLFHALNLGADSSYAQNFSKSFQYFLRKRLKLTDAQITFHCFRHGMADALRSVNTPDSLLKAILGHEDKSVTANYGSQEYLGRMKKYIDKVDFKIDWEKLK